MRLHDLRHTCASLAISSGANIKVVQKLLGHNSAVLTLDRYGHLFPDDLDAVAAAFNTAGAMYCVPAAYRASGETNQAPSKGGLTWWQVQDSNLCRR